jgi:hypothetical protein
MTTTSQSNLPPGKRVQYLIEDDIDFFNELRVIQQSISSNRKTEHDANVKQSTQKEETTEETKEEKKTCLITNDPLTQYYVTLDCKHSFNYEPLYNEVKMQKYTKNVMDMIKCSHHEFRCPFCRKTNPNVLTYYPELDDKCPILYGVNTLDTQYKIIYTCQYVKYIYTDGTKMYCNYSGDNLCVSKMDNQHYCYTHKHMIEQQHIAALKHKERLEKAKKAKEEKMQQQLALKEKQQAAKIAKQSALKTKVAQDLLASIDGINEVVSSNQPEDAASDPPLCEQILKTGLFKGDPCNRPIFKHNMCKRHYNLSNAKLLPSTEAMVTDSSLNNIAT